MSDIYRIDYFKPSDTPGYEVFCERDAATRAEFYLLGKQYARLEFVMPDQRYKLATVCAIADEAFERGKSARSAEFNELLRK